MAGNSEVEEVLKPSTMLLPKAVVDPLTTRSGETAPLKTYREGLEAAPDWKRLVPEGLISYQRTSLPAPPLAVCCVQIATPPRAGSSAETACVSRASSVSSTLEVPSCGAF